MWPKAYTVGAIAAFPLRCLKGLSKMTCQAWIMGLKAIKVLLDYWHVLSADTPIGGEVIEGIW